MDKKTRLTQIADKLLEMKEHEEALRDLGKRNPEQASAIENIFAAFTNLDRAVESDKFKSIVSLIASNIKGSAKYSNFDTEQYKRDKKYVFELKSKYINTGILSKTEKIKLNEIWKEHQGISKILSQA